MTARALVDRALSTSFIAALTPSDQKHVCDQVLDIVENDPALVGNDEIQFPYVTELQVFRSRGVKSFVGRASRSYC